MLLLLVALIPELLKLLKKAKKHFENEPITLVMGGFHLLREDDETIATVINQFKELSIEKVGPTHCTGDHVIKKFKEEFGEDFVQMGIGFAQSFEID